MPKGKLPSRVYFFNILNTVEPEYTHKLIAHANEMRNSGINADRAQD